MTTTATTAITAISHPLSLVVAGVGVVVNVGVGVDVDVDVDVCIVAVLSTVSVAVEAAEMFPASSITNR